jgi:hypothetical protein
MLSLASQAVNACAHKEVRAQFMRFTKQLVNIAFAIANMYAAFRFAQ